jgi:alkylation response protein AidB-like acyl-CoA dehydrogenase
MTQSQQVALEPIWPQVPDAQFETLAARFRPIFAKIRAGAVERDRNRILPVEELQWLRAEKFGAIRVPREHGGYGASLVTLFALLIELAEADSNLAQILRGHFGFIETLLPDPTSPWSARWLTLAGAGDWFSPAHTEPGDSRHGSFATVVTDGPEGPEINGRKFYTTGAYYADWIGVTAGRNDAWVTVVVSTKAEGLTIIDDWDGFGQALTASGTTIFDHVKLDEADFVSALTQAEHLSSVYQLTHLATLSGIGRAAASETATYIAERRRTYAHGNADTAREDPQILQVVGSVFAKVYGANVATITATTTIERFFEKLLKGEATEDDRVRLDVEVFQAQVATATQILEATTLLFGGLGASALSKSRGLDRLWRNARAISSHNPLIYRERQIGDYVVNGNGPQNVWVAGTARNMQTAEELQPAKADAA